MLGLPHTAYERIVGEQRRREGGQQTNRETEAVQVIRPLREKVPALLHGPVDLVLTAVGRQESSARHPVSGHQRDFLGNDCTLRPPDQSHRFLPASDELVDRLHRAAPVQSGRAVFERGDLVAERKQAGPRLGGPAHRVGERVTQEEDFRTRAP